MFLYPMPGPRSAEAPLFSGDNLAAFLHEYERMCVRYGTSDDRAAMLVEDYCVDILSSIVHELYEKSTTFSELKEAMRATWGAYDKERMLGTIEALDQLVASAKEGRSMDAIVFTRQFRHLVQRAEAAGNPIDKGQLIKKYLTGLSREMQRRVVGKTRIDCLAPNPEEYNKVLQMAETITKDDRSLDLLNNPLSQLDVLSHLRSKEHSMAPVGWAHQGHVQQPVQDEVVHYGYQNGTQNAGPTALHQRPYQHAQPHPHQATGIDDLADSFGKLKLSAVALGPLLSQAGLKGAEYALVLSRAAVPDSRPSLPPAPVYGQYGPAPPRGPPAPSGPYQQRQYGSQDARGGGGMNAVAGNAGNGPRSPMVCWMCNLEGHGTRRCPALDELIQKGEVHWNTAGRVQMGSFDKPGPEFPTLPLTNRLDFIYEQLQQRKAVNGGNVVSIGIRIDDDSLDNSDAELDPHVLSINAVRGKGAAKADNRVRDGRVEKQPARVKTHRPGYYVPDPEHVAENARDDRQEEDDDEDMTLDRDMEEEKKKQQRLRPVKITDYIKEAASSDAAIVERILMTEIPMSIADLIAKMPAVQKLLFKALPPHLADPIRPKLQEEAEARKAVAEQRKAERAGKAGGTVNSAQADEVIASDIPWPRMENVEAMTALQADEQMAGDIIWRHDSPRVNALIGERRVRSLLDSGAEMNVIRQETALRCGLSIGSLPPPLANHRMFVANGHAVRFVGICLDVPIKIGDITISTHLLVVEGLTQDCILGEPYACRASLRMDRSPSGIVTCNITSEDGRKNSTFQASNGIERLVSTEKEMFLRLPENDEAEP